VTVPASNIVRGHTNIEIVRYGSMASSRSRSTPGASNKHEQNFCSWAPEQIFCIMFAKVLDVPKEEEGKVRRSREYKNNSFSFLKEDILKFIMMKFQFFSVRIFFEICGYVKIVHFLSINSTTLLLFQESCVSRFLDFRC
jgi:hypothetical protein